MGGNTSYSSPKVEMRESPISGRGLFAKGNIKKDELVVSFVGGKGKFVVSAVADELFEKGDDHVLQIDDDLYFAATTPEEYEKEDHINHSCNPNIGIDGNLNFVAIRDIEPGEEIVFDYTMSESSEYSFECRCGSKNCRKTITGNDWKIPELQKKYSGYFSDYLAKKML
ncbi:MAG: Nuclear protein SET [Candidatus Giovannonibacteria bacterium GW2011_GWA2_44_13b]|uniref:Nuclear protein SET n=2 Tax=Candidatus Giovannoniibacteriota TaxID=1752738 RepID=A0A0G1H2G4_9BACT|nr:MAG: Nuclear protein SET [Candidatus Giovannonibacteria bacterium GW2011_GWA2_44_13b]OGF82765.1 MAG: hypothetical protein A2924_03515 [Candidatus Giovannonibacteria bacterium RIFCSPLOWO2_01_FULL_44_16]